MHDILMLMPLILTMLFFNRGSIERFENEKCDITDRKIKLLEEKIVLETNQNTKGSLHSKEIEIKLNELSLLPSSTNIYSIFLIFVILLNFSISLKQSFSLLFSL